MLFLENLNNKNQDSFIELLRQSKKLEYRLDFNAFYENKSFIMKFIVKKFIKLIKYNELFVGFIWLDYFQDKSVNIKQFFILDEYIKYINHDFFKELNNSTILLEEFEDHFTSAVTKNAIMLKIKETNLLKLSYDKQLEFDFKPIVEFYKFNKRKDEKARCYIQNKIFDNNDRIPLTVSDIQFDTKQEYFIDDLCYFILVNKEVVGYGQVIYTRGMYSVVNFGIISGYRNKGYAIQLLNKLCLEARKKKIKDIYIRVDKNNIKALSLYKKVGFEYIGNISTWIWNKIE